MAKQRNFNHSDNVILTEIYRRKAEFKKDKRMLIALTPHNALRLKTFGIIVPNNNETKRTLNWYNLTDLGAKLFTNVKPISEEKI